MNEIEKNRQNLSQKTLGRGCSYVDARNEAVIEMNANNGAADLEVVFRAQYERIARVIAGVVRDHAGAEELAVEVLLKWDRHPAAHGENAEGWLYRTAPRMAVNDLRRELRRNRHETVYAYLFSHLLRRPLLALLFAFPLCAASQSPVAKPAFEVVSIKPNTTGRNASIAQQPGGRFVVSTTTLRRLMQYAYRGNQQFIGGPEWLDSDRWDIEARAAEGTFLPSPGLLDMTKPDMLALMVQSLLEDRFKLRVHTETRELPLYELVIAKGGSKLKLSDDQTPPPSIVGGGSRGSVVPRGGFRIGSGDFEGQTQSISILTAVLSALFSDRPVIDKTGLKERYDIKLQWDPNPLNANTGPNGTSNPPPAALGPSLAAALEEQLGLHLQSGKGPLSVLVIDSVQKPSEN